MHMPYRPTEKTRLRRERTREAIIEAALAQVAEGGYASAGVQAVATRADVATGSVYRHFSSKAELFAEVFRRAAHRELAVVERTVAETGDSTLERIAAAAEAFARTLDEGVAAGELPPHDTATVAAALVGALGEALVGPLSEASPPEHDRLVATLVKLCTDAVPREEIAHGRRLAPVA